MMGLLDFAAKYLPEVNEWKMAKEAKLHNEERNWYGQHHFTEALTSESAISTKKRPKKIVRHKRKGITCKQKASMDAHIKRITKASLSRCQKPVETNWDVNKQDLPKKETTESKILMTKDVQTIETSSHLSIASRIDSEIKSFKEKREDFINYLQILQSEIKALEVPHGDYSESRATLNGQEKSIEKDVGINEQITEEKAHVKDVSASRMEYTIEELRKELSEKILKENKEQVAQEVSAEVITMGEESNRVNKVERMAKKLIPKSNSHTLEKKVKFVKGQNENRKSSSKKNKATSNREDNNNKLSASSESKKVKPSAAGTDVKVEPNEVKEEAIKVKENSKKPRRTPNCVRRITTVTSGNIKTKFSTDRFRHSKIKLLREEDINREVIDLVIPKLRNLARQGKILSDKTKEAYKY
ncbi:uncharacterized protein isoform X2 [Rhodnius prolixus]|uniref:uncharacterized protein isoform X2 n=1 Tax=Rhodnius prolixus TaxID=13249 RepID=UPI003D18870E